MGVDQHVIAKTECLYIVDTCNDVTYHQDDIESVYLRDLVLQ